MPGGFRALLEEATGPLDGLKMNVVGNHEVGDPKMPIFHSGETSQEPFSMTFDLSNQGEYKTKDDFV